MFEEFILANKFKNYCMSELSRASFVPLKTNCPNIFAYARGCSNYSVIVIGNLDFDNPHEVVVKVPKFKQNSKIINVRVNCNIDNTYMNKRIKANLKKGEIQVLVVRNLVL